MSMADAAGDVVACQGLVKRYGTRAALSGCDLRIRRGEVFGLVGANGGSKTTILRIMAGLLQPDAGTCTVFGQAPARARSRIGYMAQGQGLYGHLTVAENLTVASRRTSVGTATKELLFGQTPRAGRLADDALRILELTEGARVDSIPNLEIETGQIEGAGHASTTGRFDDEQLFYLQSRGIPEAVARRLVVRGFFGEILSKITIPELRERLEAAVEAELAVTDA